jgi:hypothetical protein
MFTYPYKPQRRHELSQSEIARLRQRIADEYQSAQSVFRKFTSHGKHLYYTQCQERIAIHFEELQKHLSPEQAMQILIEESNKHA